MLLCAIVVTQANMTSFYLWLGTGGPSIAILAQSFENQRLSLGPWAPCTDDVDDSAAVITASM